MIRKFDPAPKLLVQFVQAMRRYHDHEVVGLQHIPTNGRCLIVVNHSLATYDIALLLAAIYFETGRRGRPLLDRLFFKVPLLGDFMTKVLGCVQGSQETAEHLLADDHIVTVAPGGMREALRTSEERYQIRWDGRLGFIRLAMKTGAPIVLAACPQADDLFDVYPSHLTQWFYQTYRVPVFICRGLGLTPVPRPVPLTHYISKPLMPPPWSDDEALVAKRAAAFHAQVIAAMTTLMAQALAHPQRQASPG